jgi:hypothetical protein
VLVAAFGMISFLTDRDVVTGTGPLIGPAMGAASVLLFFLFLLYIALRIPKERQRIWLGGALAIGVACYFVYPLVGAILVGAGDLFEFLAFLGTQLVGPYAVTAGVAAIVVALLYMIVIASRVGENGRPRWPWERDEE